jgi:hydrogenase-4 component F
MASSKAKGERGGPAFEDGDMLLALVLLPAVAGAVAYALPTERFQRAILVAASGGHLALVIAAVALGGVAPIDGLLQLDALGMLFLSITSTLFFAASVYAVGYLKQEVSTPRPDWVEGVLFSNAPQRVFVACMLLFLAAMTLVTVSHHFGLLWVAVEATTLASAPLIYFHRHHRSLEATWKYLLICSVGIALALMGTFFIAVAASSGDGRSIPLAVDELVAAGEQLNGTWLRAAFLLLLVGYGTKMGLAPFHTWLPDAHSESPSLVSALMSGALLNCAFVGILRTYQVAIAAGEGQFVQELLIGFGLVSMAVAAVFIIRQADYKRMLAYSSVEHMGILALGVGIGGAATFGAMFHAVNHSLAKGLLFLVAGNILAMYRTTSTRGVRGLIRALPTSGALWMAGFLAVTGSPPFGSFLSEFIILQASITNGHAWAGYLYLALLGIIFIGMAAPVIQMTQGQQWEQTVASRKESILAVAPPIVLALALLGLGVYLPPELDNILQNAARLLGGGL